jgi:hypothetical protein
MFRIFYAEKDATLYESAEYYNTGLDEILEIGKRLNTDGSTYLKSRALVKFDLNEINSVLSKYSLSANNCKFMLHLFTTHAKNLPAEYSIDAKIVAQPWINGTGFLSSTTATQDGVNWAEPYASWSFFPYTGNNWISGSQNIQVNGTSLYATGSGKGGSWLFQSGSGVFNSSFFNQAFFYQPGLQEAEGFSYRPTDINMDVTEAVLLWKSGSGGNAIANNGFLLKFSDADESNTNVAGYVRFFSRETHTIYVPRLVMYWDDSNFTTGSLQDINTESYIVYTNIKPTYKDTEIAKVRIYGRDKYPRKSPTNLFPIQTVKHLPTTTYYSISDAATDEVIIPFDDIYTKVSCDSTSNFIYLDMNGLMPERNYRLNLKIVDGFMEQYIDDQIYFKVVR